MLTPAVEYLGFELSIVADGLGTGSVATSSVRLQEEVATGSGIERLALRNFDDDKLHWLQLAS